LALFGQALEHDPDYARVYAGMSEAYMIGSGVYIPSAEAGPKAKELANKALRLDDQLSEAHCTLAVVLSQYDWEWATAEQEYKRPRDLDPASGCVNDAYPYGSTLAIMGRFEEALPELRRALRLDSRSTLRHLNLGVALYWARRYDEARKEV